MLKGFYRSFVLFNLPCDLIGYLGALYLLSLITLLVQELHQQCQIAEVCYE